MTEKLIIALLSLLSIGSLAAVFVLWAKLDEQKKLTQEEKEKRWDEISRSAGLEKIAEEYAWEKERYENNMRFADKELLRFMKQRDALQDRLSALLCPRNDHVWKDGVCVKCGRVKDATASPN